MRGLGGFFEGLGGFFEGLGGFSESLGGFFESLGGFVWGVFWGFMEFRLFVRFEVCRDVVAILVVGG